MTEIETFFEDRVEIALGRLPDQTTADKVRSILNFQDPMSDDSKIEPLLGIRSKPMSVVEGRRLESRDLMLQPKAPRRVFFTPPIKK